MKYSSVHDYESGFTKDYNLWKLSSPSINYIKDKDKITIKREMPYSKITFSAYKRHGITINGSIAYTSPSDGGTFSFTYYDKITSLENFIAGRDGIAGIEVSNLNTYAVTNMRY